MDERIEIITKKREGKTVIWPSLLRKADLVRVYIIMAILSRPSRNCRHHHHHHRRHVAFQKRRWIDGRSKADKWEWLKLQNVVPICPTKLYISRRVAFFFPFPMVGRWRDFSEKMKYLCPPSLESTRGKFVNTLVEIYRHARRPRENKGGRRRNHTLVVVSFLNFKAEDLQ